VHLFGFITKKFVTMHGHMNVKSDKDLLIQKRRIINNPVSTSH